MTKEMDRRSFLRGAALTGIAAAGAGLVACSPQAENGSGGSASGGGGNTTAPTEFKQASANITVVDEKFVIAPAKASEVTADETYDADYLVIGS
ncbi:MAG: twin-arginine translocation signal domain-containing protein, partial [Coriobacteriales bacterium]|nr:twin-arginine translocation signal domain-containing protein [Coriobacteriales bacterium]